MRIAVDGCIRRAISGRDQNGNHSWLNWTIENGKTTTLDYSAYISSTLTAGQLDALIKSKPAPRLLFWAPDALTAREESLLVNFAAYRSLMAD